jgi:phosphonate C-P lyase system protein PhnG
MVRAEEPSERLPFNLAEVTVSEAEVSASGRRGYAMVMGRFPEKALAGAILDVAVEGTHPLTPEIESLLHRAIDAEEGRVGHELQQVAPTRVRFEEILQ